MFRSYSVSKHVLQSLYDRGLPVLCFFDCKRSFNLVSIWRVVIPMYVLLASHEQVNLYTTLHNKAKGVSHLRGKYEAVFMVLKYTLILILNLSLIKFARRFANWLEVFP